MTTKDKVLSLLNNAEFISGEELALKCQVSRAAVHKAITSLRQKNWQIEAVTNKGYRIVSSPDSIQGRKIQELIETSGAGKCEVFGFDSIDSTNLEAKRRTADKKLSRVLFVSGRQTAGRGRMGRPFVSPADSGVYFTLVYSPEEGVKNPSILTAAAAVAVKRMVEELYGLKPSIKWVNDVFLYGKKICGILTEGVANFETGRIDTAIVGIGINVRNGHFDEEVSKVAGCIEDLAGTEGLKVPEVTRNQITASVVSHLLKIYSAYDESSESEEVKKMLSEYREASLLIGKTVTVNPVAGLEGKMYKAEVLDITDEAELVVRTVDGMEKKLNSGEVSIRSGSLIA